MGVQIMKKRYFTMWFNQGERQTIAGLDELSKVAKEYDFDVATVINTGSFDFDDDDGNGAYGGVFEIDPDTYKPLYG